MTLALGQWFGDATIRYLKAGTTVAIAAGDLLMQDTTNGGFIKATATTTTFGPYAVAVSAMATGGTQVKACTRGLVCVQTTQDCKPNLMLQPSTSTAGRVMKYAARTINVTTDATEWKRPCGMMMTASESLGDGSVPTTAASTSKVIIDLRSGF